MKEKQNTVKGDCYLGVIQNSQERGADVPNSKQKKSSKIQSSVPGT